LGTQDTLMIVSNGDPIKDSKGETDSS